LARVAVTGVGSFLGSRVLRRLVESRGAEAVIAVDVAPPAAALGVRHHRLDLAAPAADQRLLELLRADEVRTVVHAAQFTNPQRDAAHAHELESIGTLGVMAASAAAGVEHVIVRSFTAVYGARGQNPAFLGEDAALPAGPGLAWARDKLEACQHAAAFARRFPRMAVTVLRFAPLLGPGVRNFYTGLFDRRVVPVVMGYDPLLQLLHPDDALDAVDAALARAPRGPINVVPRRAIPLLAMLHTAAKIPLPVPHPLAALAADALWAAGLGPAPGGFVDYARFPFLADGARAEREMGFTARRTSREALLDYLRHRGHQPAPHGAEVHA